MLTFSQAIEVLRVLLCCLLPSGLPLHTHTRSVTQSHVPAVQVFHVPLEERRYKDNSQFGEGEEAKVCLDIMQRTGAHIELSLAKDQGLSIMVTGKLDSVMKARKEIVARLQTQVKSLTLVVMKQQKHKTETQWCSIRAIKVFSAGLIVLGKVYSSFYMICNIHRVMLLPLSYIIVMFLPSHISANLCCQEA